MFQGMETPEKIPYISGNTNVSGLPREKFLIFRETQTLAVFPEKNF